VSSTGSTGAYKGGRRPYSSMRATAVLRDAFAMLRDQPLLFLPRIAMTVVTSALWIMLLGAVGQPVPAALDTLLRVAALSLVVLPLQTWVYNGYFFVVARDARTPREIANAFRAGLGRLLPGVAAVVAVVMAGTVAALPGAFAASYGVVAASPLLQAAGAALAVAALLAATVLLYFVPVAVVLGDGGFVASLRRGVATSRQRRGTVTAITLLSFGVLAATLAVEGTLRDLGLAGFVVGRLLSAVASVYLIVVNPELYLDAADR